VSQPQAAQSIGQVAYEAYSDHADGMSLVSGEHLPGWDELSPVIAEAWEAAAAAVARLVLAGTGTGTGGAELR
jgi:hypothetical protein